MLVRSAGGGIFGAAVNLVELAQRLKDARLLRGLTLDEVSERSGLAKGLLSKVENFRVTPTLVTLSKLTEALGLKLSELLDGLDEKPSISVVRREERLVIERNKAQSDDPRLNNYYESLVARGADRAMEPFEIRVPAKGGRQEALQHEGEEFLLVLEGRVKFLFGDEVIELKEGDSIYFDAEANHRLFNDSNKDARVVSVMCFGGRGKR